MKKYIVFVLAVLLIGALATGALAGKDGRAGKSNVAHLYLYEKDAGWNIVVGGAWGKMKYNVSGSTLDFLFNGHGLEPNIDYSLIYYPEPQDDPWVVGGGYMTVLASGTSNRGGNIHLRDSWDPDEDFEYDPNGDDTGAKIWLVLTDDLNPPDRIVGWNPTEYLFEHVPISFDDTDV